MREIGGAPPFCLFLCCKMGISLYVGLGVVLTSRETPLLLPRGSTVPFAAVQWPLPVPVDGHFPEN